MTVEIVDTLVHSRWVVYAVEHVRAVVSIDYPLRVVGRQDSRFYDDGRKRQLIATIPVGSQYPHKGKRV